MKSPRTRPSRGRAELSSARERHLCTRFTAGSRIPSLDGLRAISIALVLFGHLLGGRGFVPLSPALDKIDFGNLGVRVFFVISGFLISSILFAEMGKSGTLSLAKFYFRRGLSASSPRSMRT